MFAEVVAGMQNRRAARSFPHVAIVLTLVFFWPVAYSRRLARRRSLVRDMASRRLKMAVTAFASPAML